jgi:cell shape-determining protein MreD
MSSRFSIYLLVLLVAVFIENTVTTLPIVFVLLLFFSLMKKRQLVFALAFITGIILDIFALRPIGVTSIYLLIFLFLAVQYERKFHITSISFIVAASFVGSFLYLVLFGYHAVIIQTIISVLLSALLYILYHLLSSSPKREFEYSS